MKPQALRQRLGPFLLIAAALGLAAVIAINAQLFYGQVGSWLWGGAIRVTCNTTSITRSIYSRPSYSLNPLPLEFDELPYIVDRCGLTSGQITDAYAQKWPLAVGWSLTLLASGVFFLASGAMFRGAAPHRRLNGLATMSLVSAGVTLLIAAVVSFNLLLETRTYHDYFPLLNRYGPGLREILGPSDSTSGRSAANLAMTTWNPLQQVLVFALAPVGVALSLVGLALSSPSTGRFRVIASKRVSPAGLMTVAGFLCSLLLLAGPVVAIFPNSVLRALFAVGLGAAPLLLTAFGAMMLRHSASPSVGDTGQQTVG